MAPSLPPGHLGSRRRRIAIKNLPGAYPHEAARDAGAETDPGGGGGAGRQEGELIPAAPIGHPGALVSERLGQSHALRPLGRREAAGERDADAGHGKRSHQRRACQQRPPPPERRAGPGIGFVVTGVSGGSGQSSQRTEPKEGAFVRATSGEHEDRTARRQARPAGRTSRARRHGLPRSLPPARRTRRHRRPRARANAARSPGRPDRSGGGTAGETVRPRSRAPRLPGLGEERGAA